MWRVCIWVFSFSFLKYNCWSQLNFQASCTRMTFWTNFRATAKSGGDGIHFDPNSLALSTKVGFLVAFSFWFPSTERLHRMKHRKWKETKQQPGTAGPGNKLGCCLVSLHFLCHLLCGRSVLIFDHGFVSCRPYRNAYAQETYRTVRMRHWRIYRDKETERSRSAKEINFFGTLCFIIPIHNRKFDS